MAIPETWLGPKSCLIEPDEQTHNAVKLGGKYISLTQLHRATGINHAYISRIMQGKRQPSTRFLLKITRGLRLHSLEELMYWIDQRTKAADAAKIDRRLFR